MKTEHAIDWRKTAEEIEADYSALCMDRDEKAERICALEAHNAVLREVLEELIDICTPSCCQCEPDVGYRCRACEPIEAVKMAKQALASTPESSLAEIRLAERERVANVLSNMLLTRNANMNDLFAAIRQMED